MKLIAQIGLLRFKICVTTTLAVSSISTQSSSSSRLISVIEELLNHLFTLWTARKCGCWKIYSFKRDSCEFLANLWVYCVIIILKAASSSLNILKTSCRSQQLNILAQAEKNPYRLRIWPIGACYIHRARAINVYFRFQQCLHTNVVSSHTFCSLLSRRRVVRQL